ncbi:uncharacterized protein EDB91DRAFT_1257500 [Suillus paluster]|uniref:uncharacterized protein n=1 Tax=Suillus paluster TaxID=48578 RepID=UPI001B85BC20|nr:uncharacterized protein EDB91DRAFT_1257500 [Suillus paluster]KAG1719645.1 hypothetical protein EDB91DRAFT_1257500 [Suillus paluster]
MARTKHTASSISRSPRSTKTKKSKGSSSIRKRAAAVMGARSRPLPRPPKELAQAISSFSIPINRAEAVPEDFLVNHTLHLTYGAPEDLQVIDPDDKKAYTMCRVPVKQDGQVFGYVPLPFRYKDLWLELCYNVVAYATVWKLWNDECKKGTAKQMRMATVCRQNSGTMLVTHMHARLMAVDQLVAMRHDVKPGAERVPILDEWKVRHVRDWFGMTFREASGEGQEFLLADPTSTENKAFFGKLIKSSPIFTSLQGNAERDWAVENEGLDMMAPPEDLQTWIAGEIQGFKEKFHAILKPQAYSELNRKSKYFYTRHEDGARLPQRWHEGHHPPPHYWTKGQWDWMAKGDVAIAYRRFYLLTSACLAGNDYWQKPLDLVYDVLSRDVEYEEFLSVINSISIILQESPRWDQVKIARQGLWMGEMTWRESVDLLRQIWELTGRITGPWQEEGEDVYTPYG